MVKTRINRELTLPEHFQYIGVFLTLRCNFSCTYCINDFEPRGDDTVKEKRLSADEWIMGLNRLVRLYKPDGSVVPVTLQGGEPTLHPGFFEIINGLDAHIPIDILTNLSTPAIVDKFIENVDPMRLRRDSPYASIRVSYHPNHQTRGDLVGKTKALALAGYDVGIWGLDIPGCAGANAVMAVLCKKYEIDFRLKDFLGYHDGKLWGAYKYPDACTLKSKTPVKCRGSELLIAPDGYVYRCHHDLYNQVQPLGHILDNDHKIRDQFWNCPNYGHCNPCDVKIKTNRLQEEGHTSVEIKFRGN